MLDHCLWFRLIILANLSSFQVCALQFILPKESVQVVGELQWTQVLKGDDFNTIGKRYGIGYHEMIEANPGVCSASLEPGTIIVLPTRFLLPQISRKGIVINLAELRLYYYEKESVYTYPIGIGRAGWDTPLGLSYISAKLKDPVWHVPKSIQQASSKEGIILADKVLPGEDNPLGAYALRLHYHNYLIHGTNEIEGVGRRSTAGCIRMFPEDIKELFDKVAQGTLVNIINEPYKLGWDSDGKLYLEAHLPLKKVNVNDVAIKNYIQKLVNQAIGNRNITIIWDNIQSFLQETIGVPLLIGYLKDK